MSSISSQNTVKDNIELSDKIDWPQMYLNSLKDSKFVLEENLPSISHRARVVENQTEALIIRLAELVTAKIHVPALGCDSG